MANKITIIFFMVAFSVISCSSGKVTAMSPSEENSSKRTTVVKKPSVKKSEKKETVNNNIVNTKKKNVTESEVLESTSKTVVSTDMVYEYVMKYSEIAMQNMKEYGIPASIILAQGVLESGSGKGVLSSKSNNHFGIKCHKEWTGESVLHDDDTKNECFRKYNDPADSYRDHALFLTSRPRYASLFQLPKEDYQGWAKGLRAAGYATDPGYPQKLIGLIERYQLYKFDYLVTGKLKPENFYIEVQPQKTAVNQPAPKPVLMTDEAPEVKPTKPKETPAPVVVVSEPVKQPETTPVKIEVVEVKPVEIPVVKVEEPVKPTETIPTTTSTSIETSDEELEVSSDFLMIRKNDATYAIFPIENLYKVNRGDTMYSISKKFNVTVEQLTDWNRISENSLAIGQILRVK